MDIFHLFPQIHSPPFSILMCVQEVVLYGLLIGFLVLWCSREFVQRVLLARNWRKGRVWGWGIYSPSSLLYGSLWVGFIPFRSCSNSLQVLVPVSPLASFYRPKWWLLAIASFEVPHQCLLILGTLCAIGSGPLVSSPQFEYTICVLPEPYRNLLQWYHFIEWLWWLNKFMFIKGFKTVLGTWDGLVKC